MDTHQLPQVMVATARQRGLCDVLGTITHGIAQCPNTVLIRIWLVEPDRLCDLCRSREDASENQPSLHLAASAGMPRNPQADYSRLDGSFIGLPWGSAKSGM